MKHPEDWTVAAWINPSVHPSQSATILRKDGTMPEDPWQIHPIPLLKESPETMVETVDLHMLGPV